MDASAWDERYAAAELVWSRGPNEVVAAECADLPPGRAVDLACGEGRNAVWLASLGWQVTAIDFSQVALDKGAALSDDVDWICADATRWRGDGYDLAVVAYLQLPAGERRRAHRNTVESLRRGGTFLLVAHDTTNLTDGTGGPQDARVLMSAQDVLDDLHGIEVEVHRAERVARVVRGEPGTHQHEGRPDRTAWDCLVRLVRV